MRYREFHEADKRERIKSAARSLFQEAGYEGATLQEVALKAGVSLGILCQYAQDKRDLIVLMFNDEMETLIARGTAQVKDTASFSENFIAFARVFYDAFVEHAELARTYLQFNFFADGMNTEALEENRRRKLYAIRRMVEIGQQRGELRLDIDAELVTMHLLLLHSAAVRGWIAQHRPNVKAGITVLKNMVTPHIQGLRRT